MDVRGSQLIVVLFLVFAAIVSIVAYVGFRSTARYAALLELERQRVEANDRDDVPGRNSRRQSVLGTRQRVAVNDETRTIKRLQELLEHRSATLQRQGRELEQAKAERASLKAEYERLRTEYERMLQQADWQLASIVSEVWQNISNDDSLTQSATMEGNRPESLFPGAELPTSADGNPAPETELAVADWELAQARARIVELELSVLREFERSARATEAIIAIGSPAAPALTVALSDTNPEIRRWAATVLGRMGPDATAAVDSLRQALRDTDADVAQAARQALDQIEGRF